MIQKNKLIRQILLFVVLLAITFWLLLKDASIDDLIRLIQHLKYRYVFIGLFFAFVYVICESFSFKLIFNTLKQKTKFINLMRYSFIGFYFSAITPSASGGQPMQMYYMRKDGIALSKSSLSVLLCVFGYQTSLISLFLISLLFQFNKMGEYLFKIKFLLMISSIINFTLLFFIVGMIFSKKLLPNLINTLFKFLHKIKILKNIEEKQVKLHLAMEEYHRCATVFKEKPVLLFQILGTYLFQLVVRFSISYFAAKAMMIHKGSFIDFITIQSIILFCVSSLPLPGGVGISETLYITLFPILVPLELINPAALLTQGMNYYFIVVIASIVVIYSHFRYNK